MSSEKQFTERKELHKVQITEWIACQEHIVTTSAINKLYSELLHGSRITIIGPRGCGKTSTLRAAAIRLMTNDDFEIIPCTEPSEILSCIRTYCKQIFVFDDVCETTSRTDSFLQELNEKDVLIKKMFHTSDDKNRKLILIAVDSFSFHMIEDMDKSYDISSFSSVFKMGDNILSEKEAKDIAKIYGNTDNTLYKYSKNIFFYPELCRRYGSHLGKGRCVLIESLLYEIIEEFLKVLIKDDKVFLVSLLLFVIHGKTIDIVKIPEWQLAGMSDVLELQKDSLTTLPISYRFKAMLRSEMYIKSEFRYGLGSTTYSVINDELYMGIVSFFYNRYFHLILKISNEESLSSMLQEWKTHIVDGKIQLPHHKEENYTKYFDQLSNSVTFHKERR